MREKMEVLFRKILHVMEFLIALLTLLVVIGMLGLEVYKMFTVAEYFSRARPVASAMARASSLAFRASASACSASSFSTAVSLAASSASC